jgi:hypothetical protein
MPAEPANVNQPKHPLAQLTTFELRDFRRELESAISFFDRQITVPPTRHRLQARLDEVLTEEADRRAMQQSGRRGPVGL